MEEKCGQCKEMRAGDVWEVRGNKANGSREGEERVSKKSEGNVVGKVMTKNSGYGKQEKWSEMRRGEVDEVMGE